MANLSVAQCEDALSRNGVGRLGCYSPVQHKSYVIPVAYGFDKGAISLALLPGQKLDFLRENPKGVCLEVEEVRAGSLWTTVVVTGDIVRIDRDPMELKSIHPGRQQLEAIFAGGLTPYPVASLVHCELHIREASGREDRWPPAAHAGADLDKIIGAFKSEHLVGD